MHEQKYKKVTIIVDDGEKVQRYYFPKTANFKFDVDFAEPRCYDMGMGMYAYGAASSLTNIGVSFVPQPDKKTGQYGSVRQRNSKRKKN